MSLTTTGCKKMDATDQGAQSEPLLPTVRCELVSGENIFLRVLIFLDALFIQTVKYNVFVRLHHRTDENIEKMLKVCL